METVGLNFNVVNDLHDDDDDHHHSEQACRPKKRSS